MDEISGGNQELREYLSLDRRVTPETPPCFIFHTFDDKTVDVRNPLVFAAALKENGVSAEVYITENGPHGVSLADNRVNPSSWGTGTFDYPQNYGWVDRSVAFLRRHQLWLD